MTIRFDGTRVIADPDSRWVEFTGKGVRKVKYGGPSAEAKCREHGARYASMKKKAREIIAQLPVRT